MPPGHALTEQEYADAKTLWDFHHLHHEPRPTDVGIGLGSHDLGVATHTANLYHQGMFPLIVFTGANAPTTINRFPRGEAVHYREHALSLGVPDDAILIEPNARSTVDNINFTRDLLAERGIHVESGTLISRPYQQRRAYNICRKLWPEVHVTCSVQPIDFRDYLDQIGDTTLVLNMMVGDTQRLILGLSEGDSTYRALPRSVVHAYRSLAQQGYTKRIVKQSPHVSYSQAANVDVANGRSQDIDRI
jgi:uncharacterized SAM-binding protein YcdF (DUF218 family)